MRRRLVELHHETETRTLKPANLRTTPLFRCVCFAPRLTVSKDLQSSSLCHLLTSSSPIIAAVAYPLLTHPGRSLRKNDASLEAVRTHDVSQASAAMERVGSS